MIITLLGRDVKKLGLMSTRTAAERSIIFFNTPLMIFMFLVITFKLDFVRSNGINSTV